MTNPLPLVVRRKEVDPADKIVAHACGACGTVYKDKETAEQCCAPYRCEQCGVETKRYYTLCDNCRISREEKKEQARFEKAQKLNSDEYTGPVFCGEFDGGGLGDGYWMDLGELLGHIEDEQEWFDENAKSETKNPEVPAARPKVPAYVYACNEVPFRLIAGDIVDQGLEDHYEGAQDRVSDKDCAALQRLLDEWCAGLGIVSYEQDTARVVLLGDKERRHA